MDPELKCIQFADDTTFYRTHNNPLVTQYYFNRHLIALNKYFLDWKMKLNNSKTEFINVLGLARDTDYKLRRDSRAMIIVSDGNIIEHSDNIRLLGLQLQTNNRFIKHIDTRLKKANFAKFKLNRFFKKRKIPKGKTAWT